MHCWTTETEVSCMAAPESFQDTEVQWTPTQCRNPNFNNFLSKCKLVKKQPHQIWACDTFKIKTQFFCMQPAISRNCSQPLLAFCSLKDSTSVWTLATFTATEPAAVLNARRVVWAGYQKCRNDLHSNTFTCTSVSAIINKPDQTKKQSPLFPHCMGKHCCKCGEQDWGSDHWKASHRRQVIFFWISSPAWLTRCQHRRLC